MYLKRKFKVYISTRTCVKFDHKSRSLCDMYKVVRSASSGIAIEISSAKLILQYTILHLGISWAVNDHS